jgi:predicted Zn-dependent protease
LGTGEKPLVKFPRVTKKSDFPTWPTDHPRLTAPDRLERLTRRINKLVVYMDNLASLSTTQNDGTTTIPLFNSNGSYASNEGYSVELSREEQIRHCTLIPNAESQPLSAGN